MKCLLINRYIASIINNYGSETKFSSINFQDDKNYYEMSLIYRCNNIKLFEFMHNNGHIFDLYLYHDYFYLKHYSNHLVDTINDDILLKMIKNSVKLYQQTNHNIDKLILMDILNIIERMVDNKYNILLIKQLYQFIDLIDINELKKKYSKIFFNNESDYIFLHIDLDIIWKRSLKNYQLLFTSNDCDIIEWIMELNEKYEYNFGFERNFNDLLHYFSKEFNKYIEDENFMRIFHILNKNFNKYGYIDEKFNKLHNVFNNLLEYANKSNK